MKKYFFGNLGVVLGILLGTGSKPEIFKGNFFLIFYYETIENLILLSFKFKTKIIPLIFPDAFQISAEIKTRDFF